MNIMGNKFSTLFWTFLLSIILLSSCSISNLDQPDQVNDLKQEIEINLFQDLQQPNNYKWLISTIESNLCTESELITEYQITDFRDKLFIQGLDIPNDCSSYDSQISSIEPFVFVEGVRKLEIYLANDIVSNIELTKEGDYISIQNNDDRPIISTPNNSLLPIDRNHMWGGLISGLDQDKQLFFSLYQEISELLIYDSVQKGNHGYFDTNDQSIRTFDPETFQSSEISFAIKIAEDFEINKAEISARVMSFRMTHPSIDFFISLGDGTQF